MKNHDSDDLFLNVPLPAWIWGRSAAFDGLKPFHLRDKVEQK
jgi:hypothetical protein